MNKLMTAYEVTPGTLCSVVTHNGTGDPYPIVGVYMKCTGFRDLPGTCTMVNIATGMMERINNSTVVTVLPQRYIDMPNNTVAGYLKRKWEQVRGAWG